MSGFALFRLPYSKECTLIEGHVQEFASCAALSGQQGFVMAPFAPSEERPILVIRPERVVTSLSSLSSLTSPSSLSSLSSLTSLKGSAAADYHIDFLNFHAHLLNDDFQKLVLSRSIDIVRDAKETPLMLFQRACDNYPRMFISLVYTPQSGLWLAATPEILLAGKGQEWETIALAGTMPYEEQLCWSDKNIQEQRYVATYITHQLEQFTSHFSETGPYTARAGHLAHLRSDFRFSLPVQAPIGELLQALHPTPAVCGLPKEEAFRFIQQYEHHDRSYYSGFMGPLQLSLSSEKAGGESATHLFVTLRCMQVFSNGYRLYAGGGLLKGSVEEQEWQETEAKLDTMRNIICHV